MSPSPSPSALAPSLGFATLGPVHLDVTDRGRSLRFWRDDLGLAVQAERGDAIALGTAQDTLVVLHPGAAEPARPRHAGLYHVALHLPDAAQFAALLARLLRRGVPVRPTDHTFSQALYLWDPDGLGVELALETPERGTEVTVGPGGPSILDLASGRHVSLAEPLDLAAVLAHLPAGGDEDRTPAPGTTIGHVHLQVTAVEPARRFYMERLGFLQHFALPGLVANLHAGGAFPHRLAVNAFQGEGLPPAPAGTARLRRFTIRFAAAERLEAALRGLPEASEHPDGWLVRDPSGTAVVLAAP